MFSSIEIRCGETFSPLRNALTGRFEAKGIRVGPGAEQVLSLETDQTMPRGTFRIDREKSVLRVTGSDLSMLVCGAGRILHESRYENGMMDFPELSGNCKPEKTFRGIYFATHFHNYYHSAPEDEVREYLIDQALWGSNIFEIWYDLHHFSSFDDPESAAFRSRMIGFAETARKFGMEVVCLVVANEAFKTSPEADRAVRFAKGKARGGWYDSQICPSRESGLRFLLEMQSKILHDFIARLDPSCIMFWPFDQGGCDCGKCRPWATNGFLRTFESLSELYRRELPRVKFILSAWFFTPAELGILEQYLLAHPGKIQYVLCGWNALQGKIPGVRMIRFPEISMNMTPWGGYGANPQPDRYRQEWDSWKESVDGGICYSEGIFEDINKVLFAQFFCWDAPVEKTLEIYASYEISTREAPEIALLIGMLEKNHSKVPRPVDQSKRRTTPQNISADELAGIVSAARLAEDLNGRLPEDTRSSWRWRILYLRAKTDLLYAESGGLPNEKTDETARELTELYHVQKANSYIRPVLVDDPEFGTDPI